MINEYTGNRVKAVKINIFLHYTGNARACSGLKLPMVALRLKVLQVNTEQQFLRRLLKRGHIAGKHISQELARFLIHEQIWWKEEPENFVFFMVTMIPIIGMKVLSSNILGPVSFRILKNNRLIIGSI